MCEGVGDAERRFPRSGQRRGRIPGTVGRPPAPFHIDITSLPGRSASAHIEERHEGLRHARRLLIDLGRSDSADLLTHAGDHPALAWRRAGLAAVTGRAGDAPLSAPIALAAYADGALAALNALAPAGALDGLCGAAMLGERARRLNLPRGGPVSPGGGCRLLPTIDGWIAISMVRTSDWEAVPAWLGPDTEAGWAGIGQRLRQSSTAAALDQARALGLAVGDATAAISSPSGWFETIIYGDRRRTERRARPLVIDLSSLWAGPLCGDLLGRLGAKVIKVESRTRPDGARSGDIGFYDRLNGGKASVSLDFAQAPDIARLITLIERADIVIESARPRALRQLGIDAEALVRRNPGLSWIAISAHGRRPPNEQWIGFGDDAAAAAGLSRLMHDTYGAWLFCGDAIADPLTGMHAALLAWSSWLDGGGGLHAIALHDVVAHLIATDGTIGVVERRARTKRWMAMARADRAPLYELPASGAPAEQLGQSTATILGGGLPC